jgi:hypothetical protein
MLPAQERDPNVCVHTHPQAGAQRPGLRNDRLRIARIGYQQDGHAVALLALSALVLGDLAAVLLVL